MSITIKDLEPVLKALGAIEARLTKLERGASTSQLPNSSIQGSLNVTDEDGNVIQTIGIQEDGTVGTVTVSGPTPDKPTPPTVTTGQLELKVSWDGTLIDSDGDSVPVPSDFSHVEIHLSETPGFVPDDTTYRKTLTGIGETVISPLAEVPYYVALVAVSMAGIESASSDVVGPFTPEAVVASDVIDGIVTTLKLADDAVTAAKVATGAIQPVALSPVLSDTISQRWTDSFEDANAWSIVASDTGTSWDLVAEPTAPSGGKVGQASGYIVIKGTNPILYDPNTLYRLSARIRCKTEAGTGVSSVYVGLMGLADDKVTPINRIGTSGSNNSHYYIAASNDAVPAANGWMTFTGFAKGRAATGSAGTNPDIQNPGLMQDGVRYVVPYLWLNYSNHDPASIIQVDSVTFEALRTGVVTANELQANSVVAGKIAAQAIQAGNFAAGSIATDDLAANAITGAKIAGLTITGDKIAANEITSGKIASGAITTDKLAANSIDSTKLAVGVTRNLIADPNLLEPTLSNARLSNANTSINTATTLLWEMPGSSTIRLSPTATSTQVFGRYGLHGAAGLDPNYANGAGTINPSLAYSVDQGQGAVKGSYQFSAYMVNGTAWPANMTVKVTMFGRFYDSTGTSISSLSVVSERTYTAATSGFVTNASASGATAPTNAVSVIPYFRVEVDNAVTDLRVELKSFLASQGINAVLIENGAITADKLDADAINGKTITGGTINGSAINAGNITIGSSTGSHIYLDPSGPIMNTYDATNKLNGQWKATDGSVTTMFKGTNWNTFVQMNNKTGNTTFGDVVGINIGKLTTYGSTPSTTDINQASRIYCANDGGLMDQSVLNIESGNNATQNDSVAMQLYSGDSTYYSGQVQVGTNSGDPVQFMLNGYLQQSTVYVGRVTVPGISGGGTSQLVISGLGLTRGPNSIWVCFVTANSTVPGTDLQEVSYTAVSGDGVTIKMNRSSNTDTTVSVMIMGI